MSSSSSSPRDFGRGSDDLSIGQGMVWVLVSFGLFWPRICILGFWIFSDLLADAYDSWIVPAIGFFVLPWTTGAYAMMWSIGSDGVHGAEWAFVALGVILDLLTWGGLRRLR